MIDTTKFPFEVNHHKCLNCQFQDRPANGQLCSSCQWECAMLALDVRRDNVISSELRRIEDVTSDHGIYFDETKPKQALEQLQAIANKDEDSIYDKDLMNAIKTLEQILELGYNKLRVVC